VFTVSSPMAVFLGMQFKTSSRPYAFQQLKVQHHKKETEGATV
jgi:hypothetical protein